MHGRCKHHSLALPVIYQVTPGTKHVYAWFMETLSFMSPVPRKKNKNPSTKNITNEEFGRINVTQCCACMQVHRHKGWLVLAVW